MRHAQRGARSKFGVGMLEMPAGAGSRFPLLTRRVTARRVECVGGGGFMLSLAHAAGYRVGGSGDGGTVGVLLDVDHVRDVVAWRRARVGRASRGLARTGFDVGTGCGGANDGNGVSARRRRETDGRRADCGDLRVARMDASGCELPIQPCSRGRERARVDSRQGAERPQGVVGPPPQGTPRRVTDPMVVGPGKRSLTFRRCRAGRGDLVHTGRARPTQ